MPIDCLLLKSVDPNINNKNSEQFQPNLCNTFKQKLNNEAEFAIHERIVYVLVDDDKQD